MAASIAVSFRSASSMQLGPTNDEEGRVYGVIGPHTRRHELDEPAELLARCAVQ